MASLQQEACVAERMEIIGVAKAEGVSYAARKFAVSRTTVYKLLARRQDGGLWGLVNRPRGARVPVAEEVVDLVVELKLAGRQRSTAKVRQLLAERHGVELSRQTVWRILSARGLARVVEREPLQRFVRPEPNQLWQIDLKEDVVTPAGKVHLVAVIDDASRFCLGGEWIPRKTEAAVLGAVARVLRQWGRPAAILSDRAAVFYGPATRQAGLTTYQLALELLGIKAVFAKPYKPRTKGKVEKFIQFVIHDFLAEVKDQVQDLEDLNRHWRQWRLWYNELRPHSSLGHLPPARHFRPSREPAPAELEQLLRVEVSRRVARDCTISLRGKRYPLPADLIGRHVWVGMLGDTITVEHGGKTIATFTG